MRRARGSASVTRLKLTEIFHSLQGEADTVGIPTVFVRLTGCPLRCQYCDTAYAFHGGEWWELDAILARVREFATPLRVRHRRRAAGAEGLPALLTALCDAGLRVSLETSGAMPLDGGRCAGGEGRGRQDTGIGRRAAQSLRGAAAAARPHDLVKFVICDRSDYEWSRDKLARARSCRTRCTVLFSPSHEQLAGARAGRLDPRRPPAGAPADPAAQVPVGQRARPVKRPRGELVRWCCCRAVSIRPPRWRSPASRASTVTRCRSTTASDMPPSSKPRAASRAPVGAREHRIMQVDLAGIGGSALTDRSIAVPESRAPEFRSPTFRHATPSCCRWRSRWAEVLAARDIFIGVNVRRFERLSGLSPRVHRGLRRTRGARDQGRCRGHTRAACTRR